VNMTQNELADIGIQATSMLVEKNQSYSLDTLKEFYVRLFIKRLQHARTSNFREVWKHWQKSLSWMLQHPVCVQTTACKLQGKVIDLDSDGGLVVELPNGSTKTIQSGDVNL
jgi:biotin-(acetyl-CoA carboxylase) ligase